MGRAMRNLLGVFAEMEREMISERTKAKMEATKQQGFHIGGRQPFGYERKNNMLTVNPQEAPHVRRIFEQYARGVSMTRLARDLNAQKVFRRQRNGEKTGEWNAQHIYTILHNPVYAGFILSADGETLYAGKHEALISPELREEVQSKLAASAEQMRHRMQGKALNLVFPLRGSCAAGAAARC